MTDSSAPDPRRGQMNEMLQQALHALRTAGNGNTAMTPDALVELARRAGIPNPEQLNDLTHMIGVDPAAERVPQLILFLLGTVECALPADAVQGIERITEITPIPNTAPRVLGVVKVWGSIVSVVDLRTFFGLPDVKPMQEKLLNEVEEKMRANLKALDPETMLKTWLPAGLKGFEQLQEMFLDQMSGRGPGKK